MKSRPRAVVGVTSSSSGTLPPLFLTLPIRNGGYTVTARRLRARREWFHGPRVERPGQMLTCFTVCVRLLLSPPAGHPDRHASNLSKKRSNRRLPITREKG